MEWHKISGASVPVYSSAKRVVASELPYVLLVAAGRGRWAVRLYTDPSGNFTLREILATLDEAKQRGEVLLTMES